MTTTQAATLGKPVQRFHLRPSNRIWSLRHLAGNTYRAFEMAPKVLAGIVNVNSPTVNDEIHAPMGGVRDSGWGRTGPRSLDDFSDVIWINAHSGQRPVPVLTSRAVQT